MAQGTERQMKVDDSAFFEGYFALCALYAKRQGMLQQLRNERRRGEERAQVAAELAELSGKLARAEEQFWPGMQDGAFAEYARRFNFDRFAQRVVLYLLYCELAGNADPEMAPIQLIEILDFSGKMVERMKLLRNFAGDGQLIKAGAIRGDGERTARRLRLEVALHPRHVDLLGKMVNGEEIDWHEYEIECRACEEDGIDEIPERVGRVSEPGVTLDDVVLAPELRARLEFFVDQHREGTLEKLGVTKKIRHSRGLTFLFFGPPGTGKSMLAEAVAARLGRKVLQVEVPKILSRWVGETDKQIARAFTAARANNLVLLFDEADSLLVRREMLYQDHDIRFVNDMLAAIEQYEGVVVLTTNMDTLLDPAIERRLDLRVRFDQPTVEQRQAIWQRHLRLDIALADDIDCAELARDYEFTGGYVRNAVLTAVRKMAADKRDQMTMADLRFGATMERDGLFVKDNSRVKVTGFTGQARRTMPAAALPARNRILREDNRPGNRPPGGFAGI